MAYYDIQQFNPSATSFIDTQDPESAIREAVDVYVEAPNHLYVLYRVTGDHDSEPVSIILNDVVYDLTAVLRRDYPNE